MRRGLLHKRPLLVKRQQDISSSETMSGPSKATFAMGCFWGVEALFGSTKGVIRTKCGYAGGQSKNPTYYHLGDHTEAVEMDYDPSLVDYRVSSPFHVLFTSHH